MDKLDNDCRACVTGLYNRTHARRAPDEAPSTVRVLIIEGSAVMRGAFQAFLAADPGIEVIGVVPDLYSARSMFARTRPDVLALDVDEHTVERLAFLRGLMLLDPLPVIVLSRKPVGGGSRALDALGLGAVDVFLKPATLERATETFAPLARQIRAAAAAHAETLRSAPAAPAGRTVPRQFPPTRVIAIGASTGGTRAIDVILRRFPANAPGTLIVQHMPAYFTRTFAEGLNRQCAMQVKEAEQGDVLAPGRVLVAPGDHHMVLVRSAGAYHVELTKGPREHHQRPAVDVLFRSVARAAGRDGIGVLLTGMGADGAAGLLEMLHAGARTIAQDQASSVVFGMPREAIRLGAAEKVLPLEDIASAALILSSMMRGAA